MVRMRIRDILLVAVICAMFLGAPANASEDISVSAPKSSLDLIQADYQSGIITQSEKLVNEVVAVFAPDKLADKYRTDQMTLIKSGTELAIEIKDNWSLFDSDQQAALSAMLFRPSMDNQFTSPSGRFRIHYDTTGIEPVPTLDSDEDGIPDFVERIALYSDSAATVYHDILGYLPVVIDTAGGNSAYDLFLVSIAAYGATIPEFPGDSSWNDYGAYTMIHRNFYGFLPNDDPEGDTIGAMKVTCAHEYFHAVQLAYDYDASNNLWWMEETATAMEEYIFPEVNDNLNYLPYFFNYPARSLRSTVNYHMYGAFIWPLYLTNRFDESIVKHSWEACRNNLPEIAIDSALAPFGFTTAGVFNDFVSENYFTGDRAKITSFYSDAPDYPEIVLDQSFTGVRLDSIQPVTRPDGLGANYIELTVDSTDQGIIEFDLEGSDLVRWGLSAIFITDTFDTTVESVSGWGNPVHLYFPFVEDYDKIIVAPAVVSKYLTANNYHLTVNLQPYGDANFDRTVNIGDAIYIVNYVFNGGAGPKPLKESGDANCDGSVNIGDAVSLVNYIFNGGNAPCSNR
ncbi:MAG: dockerin type I repeat-containing protein [Candidatus Zixiibacteriota bacterium]